MYIDELAGKGLELKIVAELLFQFSLSFVPMALPLAILLAALMTFGNMGEYSELTALKSSGIPLQRIMRPLIILMLFLVLVSFLFSNFILPYSNKQARGLLYDIRRKRPDINLQEGTFNNDIDGFSIKITSKDPVTNRLDNLIVYDHRDRKGNTSVIVADSGYIKITPDETALIMNLYNGYSFSEMDEEKPGIDEKTYPSRKDRFLEQTLVLGLSGFELERSGQDMFASNSWRMNMSQLSYYIDSLGKRHGEKEMKMLGDFTSTKIFYEKQGSKSADFSYIPGSPRSFDTYAIYDSLTVPEKMTILSRTIENLKDANLTITSNEEALKAEIRYNKRYEVDWHKKLTLPVACIIFFFIGAPLGAIIRKGGLGTPAVISIFFFVIWYVISLSGEKLVEEDLINGVAGMWASSYILLPVGVFLTYKASNDSMMMNVDTYMLFFRKIKNYLYRVAVTGKTKDPDKKYENQEQ